jgi:hypothetical protein
LYVLTTEIMYTILIILRAYHWKNVVNFNQFTRLPDNVVHFNQFTRLPDNVVHFNQFTRLPDNVVHFN